MDEKTITLTAEEIDIISGALDARLIKLWKMKKASGHDHVKEAIQRSMNKTKDIFIKLGVYNSKACVVKKVMED